MRRALSVVGRWALRLLGAVLVLALALALVVWIAAGTRWGHRIVLARVQPSLEALFPGGVEIGALDGNLLREVALSDVVIRDREGVAAVRIPRLSLRYALGPLLRRRLQLSGLDAAGAEVRARRLGDGEWNLRSIFVPPASGRAALEVHIADAHIAGTVLIEALLPPGSDRRGKAPLAIVFDAQGSLSNHGRVGRLHIEHLDAESGAPAHAKLALRGSASWTAGEPRAEDLRWTLTTTGEALARVLAASRLEGPVTMIGEAHGTPQALDVSARLTPARGEVSLTAQLRLRNRSLGWRGRATATALDPSTWRGAPPGSLAATVEGSGEGGAVQLVIRALSLRTDAGSASATGEYATQAGLRASLRIDADLGRLSSLLRSLRWSRVDDAVARLPSLGGRVRARAEVGWRRGSLSVDGRVDGSRLVLGPARVSTASAVVSLTGDRVKATLEGKGVAIASRAIDAVHLALVGDRRSISATMRASGEDLDLRAEGEARRPSGSLVSGHINRVLLAGQGLAWSLRAPAAFEVRAGDVSVAPLAFVQGAGRTERIDVAGAIHGGRIDARLGLHDLDLARLLRLIVPSLRAPEVRIDAALHATGSLAEPALDGRFTATTNVVRSERGTPATPGSGAAGRAGPDVWRLAGDLSLARRAIHAEGDLRGPASAVAHVEAELPLPLAGDAALAVRLKGRSLALDRLAALAQTFGAGPAAAMNGATGSSPKRDLGAALAGAGAEVDLVIGGSVRRPEIDLQARIAKLHAGDIGPIDVRGSARLREGRATLDAVVGLRGADLGVVKGSAGIDLAEGAHVAGQAPGIASRVGPIALEINVPGYPISRLARLRRGWRGLSGTLQGRVVGGGSLRSPRAQGSLAVVGLRDGDIAFDRFVVSGSADDARVRIDASATERGADRADAAQRGSLSLIGSLFRADHTIDAVAAARGFHLSLLRAFVSAFGSTSGVLDASLHVRGPIAAPSVDGRVSVRGGSFALRIDPHVYDQIEFDAVLRPGYLDLTKLHARSGEGSVRGGARASLDGLRPTSMDATLDARDFALSFGGAISTTLSGRVIATARPEGGGLVGRIAVEKGALAIPPIIASGRKRVQALGPLKDVVYVDAEAQRRRSERAKRAAVVLPIDADVLVPGTFAIDGKDLHATLKGSLRASIRGATLRLWGRLDATGGRMDLFGNRFSVDHGRLSFEGRDPVDPDLDVRLSRSYGDTTVNIDVGGSTREPTIELSSDPPRYSRAQLVALILSGQPASTPLDQSTIQQRVVGALSGAVIGSIREQLLPQLPFDVLRVQLGNEGTPGLATTRLEVGKYLTRDIYVSYVRQFGVTQGLIHVNSNQVNVEWRIKGRFEIDSSYGDAGVGGVDFAWRYRF